MNKIINTIKQEPIIFMFRKWWSQAGDQRPRIFFAMSCLVVAFGIRMLEPAILAYLLNYVQKNGITDVTINYVLFIISWFFIAVLLFSVIRTFGEYHKSIGTYISYNYYRRLLFDTVTDQNLQWINNQESGDLIDRVNNASEALHQFGRTSQKVIEIFVRFGGSYVAVSLFYPIAWILIPALLVPIWLIIHFLDKKLIPLYQQMNEFGNNISTSLFDALSNISSINILGLQSQVQANFKDKVQEPFDTFKKQMFVTRTKWTLTGTLFYVIISLTLGLFVYQGYRSGQLIEVGTISAMFLYLTRLGNGFYDLVGNYENIIKFKTSVLNAEKVEILATEKKKNRKPVSAQKTVYASNLHFAYVSGEVKVPALANLDFSFIRGEKIALIGQSGSGKTTFLKVMHGLYEGVEGEIVVDGKTIDKQLHEIDLGTTLVPQEPELFSSSVTENITFGLDYSESEIRQATDLAMFTTVAEQLPNGFDSKINEKGVNLSGGQKQRLALARALLFAREKDIILLDESTSSVDPETEVQIYQNVFEHFAGKTFIASIHKMNLLKYFDRIVMFKEGTITDEGTFDHLVQHNQEFREMWESYIETNQ